MCLCVCVRERERECVCVCKRERERARQTDRQRERERARNLFHNFIDLRKVFVRVWHAGLWKVLRSFNIDLVSLYFEPSQPQRITSRLKTMFKLSPIYSARKSQTTNYPKITKSVPTQTHLKQNTQTSNTILSKNQFLRYCPLLKKKKKKTHKARKHWYHGTFRRQKQWFFFLILYKCITPNTSAIWQYAAHTTYQLTSPSH